jgi:hypothetical protein
MEYVALAMVCITSFVGAITIGILIGEGIARLFKW